VSDLIFSADSSDCNAINNATQALFAKASTFAVTFNAAASTAAYLQCVLAPNQTAVVATVPLTVGSPADQQVTQFVSTSKSNFVVIS
jgi:hypothetical protein